MSIKFVILVDTSFLTGESSLNVFFRELLALFEEKENSHEVSTEVCILQFDRMVYPEIPYFKKLQEFSSFQDFSCFGMCSYRGCLLNLKQLLSKNSFNEDELCIILISNGNPMDSGWIAKLEELKKDRAFSFSRKICIHFNSFADPRILAEFSGSLEYVFSYEDKGEYSIEIDNVYKSYVARYGQNNIQEENELNATEAPVEETADQAYITF